MYVCVCNAARMHVESVQNQWRSQEYCSDVKNSSWVCRHTHFCFVLQTKLFFHHFLCPLLWCLFFIVTLSALQISSWTPQLFLWETKSYTLSLRLHEAVEAYVECETYCIWLRLHAHINTCLIYSEHTTNRFTSKSDVISRYISME